MKSKSCLDLIICEVCGKQRKKTSQVKNRNICTLCHKQEPSTECPRCGRMTHHASTLTGLCPSCTEIIARPVATCSRCNQRKRIDNQDACLCKICNKNLHKYQNNLKKQARLKEKGQVKCCQCGCLRESVLVHLNICYSCYNQLRLNDYQICPKCEKNKLIFNRKRTLCQICYNHYKAPKYLQSYLNKYTTPYGYNTTLFNLLTSTINWESVDKNTLRKWRYFGKFLQIQPLTNPLTWEAIEELLPDFGATHRTKSSDIRTCLLDLGYLLASQGLIESRETYIANRYALLPIQKIPQELQPLANNYAAWLKDQKHSLGDIRTHLYCLAAFWTWCFEHSIRSPEQVQVRTVKDYIQTLYWQWQCLRCQFITPFEPYQYHSEKKCSNCGTINYLTQIKRYSQETVRNHKGKLLVFFDWLKINRKVIINPVQEKVSATRPKIQHYSPEVIKCLCEYIQLQDAEPTKALILYLILIHAFSLWELQYAQIPKVLPLHQDIPPLTLASAYSLRVPKPQTSYGRCSPGRQEELLKFPLIAAPWLKPLLSRYECHRQQILKNQNNYFLLVAPGRTRHVRPVSKGFIKNVVRQVCLDVLGTACNVKLLRQTVAIMYADQTNGTILKWMGWEDQQAFFYTWGPRELINIYPIND